MHSLTLPVLWRVLDEVPLRDRFAQDERPGNTLQLDIEWKGVDRAQPHALNYGSCVKAADSTEFIEVARAQQRAQIS